MPQLLAAKRPRTLRRSGCSGCGMRTSVTDTVITAAESCHRTGTVLYGIALRADGRSSVFSVLPEGRPPPPDVSSFARRYAPTLQSARF